MNITINKSDGKVYIDTKEYSISKDLDQERLAYEASMALRDYLLKNYIA